MLLQAILVLVICLFSGDLIVRNETIQSALPPPLINGDYQIAGKLLNMDRLVAKYGRPGCILVGNSMVWRGIDPDTLGQAYRQAFHEPFWCYNFALRGSDSLAASRLATILVHEYHPRLLIYGTHFRDFKKFGNSLDIPWVGFYMGSPTVEGWLEARTYLFRYWLSLSTIPEFSDDLHNASTAATNPDGFEPVSLTAKAFKGGTLDTGHDPYFPGYADISSHYIIDPNMLTGLGQLLTLNSSDVQVVVVEMPQASGVYQALPRGQQTHQEFVDAIDKYTSHSGVLFWQTQDQIPFSNTDWWDLFHLNADGAQVFSRWLGQKLVSAAKSGQLPALAH